MSLEEIWMWEDWRGVQKETAAEAIKKCIATHLTVTQPPVVSVVCCKCPIWHWSALSCF